MGQLIREDNPYSQKTCVYAYDNCGNILSRTEYGYTDAETPAGGTVTVYEYNNAAWGDQLTSWNGESITYDAIGNPLLYRGRSLTWTQGRRLAGINAEGLNVNYTYDESGTRTGKTVNGVSTQYYINGSQILAQKSGEDILYFLYDETGAAVGFKYNNNLYLYRKNLQGDILAVLNGQTGAVEASYTYDAWGKVISSTGALAEINPFRYRGYYYDSETGLYYLQSRYYDPETGRFINADGYVATPTGSLLSSNMFSYCENNPVIMLDTTGDFALTIAASSAIVACVAIMGIGITFIIADTIAKNPPTFPTITIPRIEVNPKTETDDKAKENDTVPPKPRRDPVHHIVAKADYRAAEARKILRDVGIEPITDPKNLVVLPRNFHSRLHTNAYYRYVNERLRAVAGDRMGVEATLASLEMEIIARSTIGIGWD